MGQQTALDCALVAHQRRQVPLRSGLTVARLRVVVANQNCRVDVLLHFYFSHWVTPEEGDTFCTPPHVAFPYEEPSSRPECLHARYELSLGLQSHIVCDANVHICHML